MLFARLSLVLALSCLSAALPRPRRSSPAFSLPGGLPLDLLFASCGDQSPDGDIGPCLAQLLAGVIDEARPNFRSGVPIKDELIVLEPFAIDDIDPKKNREFQLSATDILIHGMQGVQIESISFTPQRLELEVSFEQLSATGSLSLKYLFLSANPDVVINLNRLRVKVSTDWMVEANAAGDRLDMVLSNASADFEIGDFSVTIDGLEGLGIFLQNILNNNSEILIQFLIPELEKSVSKKLNRKLNRIKLVS